MAYRGEKMTQQLKIFVDDSEMELDAALANMTEDWIDGGNYCAQTVYDLILAVKELKKKLAMQEEHLDTFCRCPSHGASAVHFSGD